MKTYIAIIIGIVVLALVVWGGYKYTKNNTEMKKEVDNTAQTSGTRTVNGEVSRTFEGENVLKYSFDIPESATTTVEMNNSLIRITDGASPYAIIYLSYEGARGYSAMDYIDNITIPKATSPIVIGSTINIGGSNWQVAESEGSEWFVASAKNGSWLIVVESKKAVHDQAIKTLESFRGE